ncbi:VOC family protein [Streptomyces curacoi]|uniref:VOC family protein n=1 Tax=Streptomyces curacoi TaxID=146536 RepID=UPI003133AD41
MSARAGAQAREEPPAPGPGCVDPEAEIGRLTALGATVQARHEDHWVPADPEGNEFRLFPTPP